MTLKDGNQDVLGDPNCIWTRQTIRHVLKVVNSGHNDDIIIRNNINLSIKLATHSWSLPQMIYLLH